jgi:DNA anti-recombination protein RmuC
MTEQEFFDQVAGEIERKQLDNGLWVRAFSLALGDDSKARAIYIALRVERLQVDHQARVEAARAAEVARTRRQQAEDAARVMRERERVRTEELHKKLEQEVERQQREQLSKAKQAEAARIKAKERRRKSEGQRAARQEILEIVGGSWPVCLLLVLIIVVVLAVLVSFGAALLK